MRQFGTADSRRRAASAATIGFDRLVLLLGIIAVAWLVVGTILGVQPLGRR
jgi:hypothetical protein